MRFTLSSDHYNGFECWQLGFSGTGIMAQLIGVLTSAIGAVMVLSLWRGDRLDLGLAPSLALLYGSMLWLGGYFFAELPLYSGLLFLILAPASLLLKPSLASSGFNMVLLRLGPVSLISLIAAFLAYWLNLNH
ncbi:MAG: hypothetical protein R2880_06330 [Deinococcales bacterium]